MSDRRRINGPAGATAPPTFLNVQNTPISRVRKPKELRRIFLQTGLIPSASGSSYFELELRRPQSRSFTSQSSTIKLSCAVHGPKPLPRNATFSPNLQLTASIKFAPFATKTRRGYVRDSTERDLGVHLENALKAVILPDRWPKSSLDVAVMVLEAEHGEGSAEGCGEEVGLMNILSGSITAATVALVDAKIDVLDLMTAGVAAVVSVEGKEEIVLDPSPGDVERIEAVGVVGYLSSRDEVTEAWTSGQLEGDPKNGGMRYDHLLDQAILGAKAVQPVLKEVMIESAKRQEKVQAGKAKARGQANDQDVEMKT